MKVLILEDERAAAERLKELLAVAAPSAFVLAVVESIADAVAWLSEHSSPDLILSDIQLADGICFEIFQQIKVDAPIIFTTAYDAYTLKAFKLNSIDYLLKPIDIVELKAALEKFHSRKTFGVSNNDQFTELLKQLTNKKESYKSRFLIKNGERLIVVPVQEVAYLRADDRVVWLHTTGGQRYIIEDSLDDLSKTLDPATFFRINRTYIAPLISIDKINSHFNGRLKIMLKQCDDKEIFVSRARAAEFKEWLDK